MHSVASFAALSIGIGTTCDLPVLQKDGGRKGVVSCSSQKAHAKEPYAVELGKRGRDGCQNRVRTI
jgi:hypothetical protein